MSKWTNDELAEVLAEFAPPKKPTGHTPLEERVLTGFEEIVKFVQQHGHEPTNRPENDILERLYAVRLKALRKNDAARQILHGADGAHILDAPQTEPTEATALTVDELAAVLSGSTGGVDITQLTHVNPTGPRSAPDEVAVRKPSPDFHVYKPAFKRVADDLKSGARTTKPFTDKADIVKGGWYVVGGLVAYVAEIGDEYRGTNDGIEARLRVIYSNGTESNLLLQTLTRTMQRPPRGRVIGTPDGGPLFGDQPTEDDVEGGTIYVLRSKSDHPAIREHREVLHKIGVTAGSVQRRIANARNEPTYLMADVEVVATYKVFNINPVRLENLLHKVLAPAQLDVQIKDRFGRPITPREWFLVPLPVIREVVDRIRDGSITHYQYDPTTGKIRELTPN